MALTEEGISNLKIALNIDDWLLQTNFKELESSMIVFQVNPKKLWKAIQENPNMTEEEYLEIARKLREE